MRAVCVDVKERQFPSKYEENGKRRAREIRKRLSIDDDSKCQGSAGDMGVCRYRRRGGERGRSRCVDVDLWQRCWACMGWVRRRDVSCMGGNGNGGRSGHMGQAKDVLSEVPQHVPRGG